MWVRLVLEWLKKKDKNLWYLSNSEIRTQARAHAELLAKISRSMEMLPLDLWPCASPAFTKPRVNASHTSVCPLPSKWINDWAARRFFFFSCLELRLNWRSGLTEAMKYTQPTVKSDSLATFDLLNFCPLCLFLFDHRGKQQRKEKSVIISRTSDPQKNTGTISFSNESFSQAAPSWLAQMVIIGNSLFLRFVASASLTPWPHSPLNS